MFQILPVEITSNQNVDLVTSNGELVSITGLTNGDDLSIANYASEYLAGLPVGLGEVIFKTDGNQGTLKLGNAVRMTLSGDDEFTVKFDTAGEVAGLEGFNGELYNSTFEFKDGTVIINNLGGSVSITGAASGNTFDIMIDNQKVRAVNDSVSAAFDSGIDYYALGDDSTLTAVTGTTKINDIELITNGTLTVTGKHYDLDDGSSYNLAQTITGLSGGDSITVNDLWSDATFAYYVSDDGTTISRISDNSIVYNGSADTLSSLNFGTISFMDYFTQTVGEVVDAFNARYATFNGTTLTIDAKTLRTNLNTQITAAQSKLATVTTITSALVIEKMDDIIKNVISSDVSIKNLLNEDMMSVMSGQIDTILSAGGDPLDIFSNLDSYNGDIFSWICDSLIVPVAQILGDSTLDRLAANLSDRLSSHNTTTIILNGSEDTVSIGAYYGDSVDASASKMENLIIASNEVTDSPQKDLVLLTGSNTHSANIQNALVLGVGGSDYSNLSVVSGDGDDTIVNWDGNNPSIFSGTGNDFIVNSHGYYSTIDSGDGDDLVVISNGHYQSINAGASNEQLIVAGAGGDSLMNYSSTAEVTMLGGAGDDVIVATSGSNEYIDLAMGGKDTIVALNTDTLTVHNYDAKTGATFLMNTHENLTNLIMYGDPYLLIVGDGYFKADNLEKVVLEGSDTLNGTFVNFTTYDDGTTQLYGWSGQAGGNVDGSDYENSILIGVAPSGYSTLTGGSGNDTIYAAADDVVNFSGGNDFIRLDHITREWRINGNIGGVTINLNSDNISADTTVKGFDTSLDKITLDDIDELGFDFNSGNLQIAVNNSSLTFENITDTTTLLINDVAMGVVAEGSTIAVTDDTISSFYGAGQAAVDYSECSDTLDVNLNGYSNINTIKGGRSNTIIWGNDDESDAIYAGSGEGAIYGGFGSAGDSLFDYSDDDTLIGGSDYNEFIYLKGNGDDVIKYAKSTDLINLLDINLEDISSADFDGLNLKLNFNTGGSLSMASLSNLTFQLADGNKYNSYQMIKALK